MGSHRTALHLQAMSVCMWVVRPVTSWTSTKLIGGWHEWKSLMERCRTYDYQENWFKSWNSNSLRLLRTSTLTVSPNQRRQYHVIIISRSCVWVLLITCQNIVLFDIHSVIVINRFRYNPPGYIVERMRYIYPSPPPIVVAVYSSFGLQSSRRLTSCHSSYWLHRMLKLSISVMPLSGCQYGLWIINQIVKWLLIH